jgi:hypothetical protein
MATTNQETGGRVALGEIRVPDNVRDLDPEHVKALAGSIKLQGMLVPVVVRNDDEGFELVAGFHRIAAASSLGLKVVPVVVRDAVTEDADRAVENITSCQRRHDVINADRVVIPMSELKCPAVRYEPGGEVGIRPWTDRGAQTAAADWQKSELPLAPKASVPSAPGDTLAFRPEQAPRAPGRRRSL